MDHDDRRAPRTKRAASSAYWAEEGATWLKFTRGLARDLGAAIDEAHKHGLKVTGHLCSVTFREAAALGIDNLEHGFFTNSDYAAGKQPDECPDDLTESCWRSIVESPEVQATFRDMIDNSVPMTSTLAIYELFVPNRPPLDQRMLDADGAGGARGVPGDARGIAPPRDASAWPELFRKARPTSGRSSRRAGSSRPASTRPASAARSPGFGDQRNYELLVEAGFTPVQAIQIMTANGAKVLGEYDSYGSIEPGRWPSWR